jgi:hypothetical protein
VFAHVVKITDVVVDDCPVIQRVVLD